MEQKKNLCPNSTCTTSWVPTEHPSSSSSAAVTFLQTLYNQMCYLTFMGLIMRLHFNFSSPAVVALISCLVGNVGRSLPQAWLKAVSVWTVWSSFTASCGAAHQSTLFCELRLHLVFKVVAAAVLKCVICYPACDGGLVSSQVKKETVFFVWFDCVLIILFILCLFQTFSSLIFLVSEFEPISTEEEEALIVQH